MTAPWTPPPTRRPAAVVFDFDGTLMDSETPVFESARAALATMGHDLTVEDWAVCIGVGDRAGRSLLAERLGAPIDRDRFDAAFADQDDTWRTTQPATAGAVALVDALAADGVPMGVASSSTARWVDGCLDRLGLLDRMTVVSTIDRVGGRGKPAPDTYLAACERLGVDPRAAIAIEDSAPGIAAATAAGLVTVVVPSPITVHTDLSGADHVVGSLVDLDVATLGGFVAARLGGPENPAP